MMRSTVVYKSNERSNWLKTWLLNQEDLDNKLYKDTLKKLNHVSATFDCQLKVLPYFLQ